MEIRLFGIVLASGLPANVVLSLFATVRVISESKFGSDSTRVHVWENSCA